MKTTEQWLSQLPKQHRNKALANMSSTMKDRLHVCKSDALMTAFHWKSSPEKYLYWAKVLIEIIYEEDECNVLPTSRAIHEAAYLVISAN